MKKFLCYDTNDAASGKINVDNRGMLKPNSTVPSTNSAPYQQLVTDGDGNVKWEDRLAYDDSKVVVGPLDDGTSLVKVADEIPGFVSAGEAVNIYLSTGEELHCEIRDLDFNPDVSSSVPYAADALVVFIAENNQTTYLNDNLLTFPQKGVYFSFLEGTFYVSGFSRSTSDTPEITWDGNIGVVKKLDEKFIPDIPVEKLPDIPVEKLPDIPAHVIEVNEGFFDSIENASQPSYTVKNLNYSEILSIFNSKNFVIKDNSAYYRPINFSISTDGHLFVQILVNRIGASGNMVVAGLTCNNGSSRFYRNNYWAIAGTKKS